MSESGESTIMIHYFCDVCEMSASMVQTNTGRLAWLDHMATHHRPEMFHSWVWYVTPLPFGEA